MKEGQSTKSFQEKMDEIEARAKQDFTPFPQEVIDKSVAALYDEENQHALDYLRFERGFSVETLKHFNIGYSVNQGLITVPMYDPRGKFPVGVIGRSPSESDKIFKNSSGLPKARSVWNIHQARRHSTLIVVEASFDGASVHQAGYPNVGALLGGSLSEEQELMIKRHFDKVIIMTDNDQPQYNQVCRKCLRLGHDMCQGHRPGRDLGIQIAERLSGLRPHWAVYDEKHIFARNMKDANKMTSDEIAQCLRNAIPHYEYMEWQYG